MKKSFWFFLVLSLVIMTVIFLFSGQNGERSTKASDIFVEKIVDTEINEGVLEKDAEKQKDKVEHLIRKTAHVLIYASLGFCVFMMFFHSGKVNKNVYLFIFSLAICIIYASSDEVHQLFVDGRSGEFKDVLIDTAGSAVGMIIAFFYTKNQE